MKTCFVQKIAAVSLAIVDLSDYYGEGLIVNRINVPAAHRGKGIASNLLREVVKEADKTGTTLFLEIYPSGGLNFNQLRNWYLRHGFEKWSVLYRRLPKEEV